MPCAGFVCHVDGRAVTPEHCLDCARRGGGRTGERLCPFTPPIVKGLIANHQPRDLLGYSATELAGCPRAVVLKEREDFWVEPAKAYWAFRGQLAHALVERAAAAEEHVIVERRLYATCGEMLVTGKPDVIYLDRQLLVDYKTTKSVPQTRKAYTCPDCGHLIRCNQWNARKGSTLECAACGAAYRAGVNITPAELPPVAYPGHVQQLNIYRWLLARHGIEIERAEVIYLDMAEVLRVQIELWPREEIESIIRAGLQRLLELGPDGLPYGVQDDADANWECRYCPVVEQCQRHAQEAEAEMTAEAIAALYGN